MNIPTTIEVTRIGGDTTELNVKWIIVNTTSSGGGVHYERQITNTAADGDTVKTTSIVVKRVDHERIVNDIAKLRNKVDYTFRTAATLVSFGFVATDAQLTALKQAIAPLREEAETLNTRARAAGSRHRIRVDMLTFRLASGDSAAAARAIADTVVTHLGDFKDALLALDLKLVKTIQIRARNLEKLAVGVPGVILQSAVDCVKNAAKTVRDGLENADDPRTIRARLDLTGIDVATTWFSADVSIKD